MSKRTSSATLEDVQTGEVIEGHKVKASTPSKKGASSSSAAAKRKRAAGGDDEERPHSSKTADGDSEMKEDSAKPSKKGASASASAAAAESKSKKKKDAKKTKGASSDEDESDEDEEEESEDERPSKRAKKDKGDSKKKKDTKKKKKKGGDSSDEEEGSDSDDSEAEDEESSDDEEEAKKKLKKKLGDLKDLQMVGRDALILPNIIVRREKQEAPTISFMDAYKTTMDHIKQAIDNGDTVQTRCPDQALQAWLYSIGSESHLADFIDRDVRKSIRVERTEGIKLAPAGSKKKWVGTGSYHVNLSGKKRRPMPLLPSDPPQKGLFLVTNFGPGAFGKYGLTVEHGVEGDRGKVFEDKQKNDSESSYSFSISCKAFTPIMVDVRTGENPLAVACFNAMKKLTFEVLLRLLKIPSAIPYIRKTLAKKLKKKGVREQAKVIQAEGHFSGKVDYDDKYALADRFKSSASVFHAVGYNEEVPADYKAPSQLFRKITANDQGRRLIHNRIRVFRCRRAEEVVDGEEYPEGPLIRIPDKEVFIDAKVMNLSLRVGVGCYEEKMKRGDVTHRLVDIIFLSMKDDPINSISDPALIAPCDPLKAIPMAGHYPSIEERAELEKQAQAREKEVKDASAAFQAADDYEYEPHPSQKQKGGGDEQKEDYDAFGQ